MLSRSSSAIVVETLRVSLAGAAADVDADQLDALARAAAALAPHEVREPHPAWPMVGATVQRELSVGGQDTAAAMGHPDPAVQVLGSPRLALWFELVTCGLLPDPTVDLSHVGVGILVHHLARAEVGEVVSVESTCASVSARRAVFTCRAAVGDRTVALGTHHRALLVQRPG